MDSLAAILAPLGVSLQEFFKPFKEVVLARVADGGAGPSASREPQLEQDDPPRCVPEPAATSSFWPHLEQRRS